MSNQIETMIYNPCKDNVMELLLFMNKLAEIHADGSVEIDGHLIESGDIVTRQQISGGDRQTREYEIGVENE